MGSGYYKKKERTERIEELCERLNGSPPSEWKKIRAMFSMEFGITDQKIGEYMKILETLGKIEKQPTELEKRRAELAELLNNAPVRVWDKIKSEFAVKHNLSERTVKRYTRVLCLSGTVKPKDTEF